MSTRWFLNVHPDPDLHWAISHLDAPTWADELRTVDDFDRHDEWRCLAAGSLEACLAAKRLLVEPGAVWRSS